MANREITAGKSIKLRTRFRDDVSAPAQATGVQLLIFEPDVDDFDRTNAYLVTESPTYIGEGIYEYEFTTPSCGEVGTWTDLWSGVLNCQVVSGIFNFEVFGPGELQEIGNQLFANNLIEVTLGSGIMATDGTFLEDEYSFEFVTPISPSYTNLRKVKLEVGSYIQDLLNITIQSAILEASIEAEQLAFSSDLNENFFVHARREWTTCKVALSLLDNVSSTALKAKQLGDLKVEYDSGAIAKTLARVMNCLEKWEPQLLAGGYAKTAQQPIGVIKGEYDYDRPAVGRLWSSTDSELSDGISGANDKDIDSVNSRRFERIFKRGKRWW